MRYIALTSFVVALTLLPAFGSFSRDQSEIIAEQITNIIHTGKFVSWEWPVDLDSNVNPNNVKLPLNKVLENQTAVKIIDPETGFENYLYQSENTLNKLLSAPVNSRSDTSIELESRLISFFRDALKTPAFKTGGNVSINIRFPSTKLDPKIEINLYQHSSLRHYLNKIGKATSCGWLANSLEIAQKLVYVEIVFIPQKPFNITAAPEKNVAHDLLLKEVRKLDLNSLLEKCEKENNSEIRKMSLQRLEEYLILNKVDPAKVKPILLRLMLEKNQEIRQLGVSMLPHIYGKYNYEKLYLDAKQGRDNEITRISRLNNLQHILALLNTGDALQKSKAIDRLVYGYINKKIEEAGYNKITAILLLQMEVGEPLVKSTAIRCMKSLRAN
jgi:hypothetical protein